MKLLKLQIASAFVVGWTALCAAQTPPFFNVKDYGATGNGSTLDSPSVNAAIAAAGAAGGGTVTFPPGTYLCGSIHLSNCPVNLTLYLSNNAVIWCSSNNIDTHESSAYGAYQDEGHTWFHDALIWGENLQNFTIEGSGKIDGHKGLVTGNPTTANPGDKALCLVLCSNVLIDGITITNGGHFGILAQACTNMTVRNARIWEKTSRDGFNLICSSFCIVSNCDIEGSDDSMCLKSTYALGRKINCQNIRIVNSTILSTENNATQIGSETVGDFRDVTWSNLVLTAAGKAGIGITSQDGSIIDGMTYDNIIMSNCACPIFLKLDYRTSDTPNPTVGRIRNISINNVYAYHSTYYSRTNTSTINGYSGTTNVPIENITFNNVHVSNIGRNPATAVTNYPTENQDWQPQNFGNWPSYGWYLRWANNISFTNCSVSFDNNDDRPAVVADTATNVLFENFTADVGSNDTNYDMGFLNTSYFDVTNAVASATAPSPGADLRIFNSNSTPVQIVSPPYFSPGDGLYASAHTVTIGSGTPGATIRYTTNDSEPGETNGTIYSGPVTINSETVLLAVAYTNGMVDSAVNTAIYNFVATGGTTALPVFNPPPGEYAAAQPVTITSATPGATIIYTTDGSTPNTNNGTIYSAPVTISANTTLQAFAYATNLTASGLTSNNYVITGTAAAPVFSLPAGTYTNFQSVTFSSATADASIRYTLDGSTPSEIAGTPYTGPVTIASNLTLNAIAYASGAADSTVSAASYTIVAAPPMFNPPGGNYTNAQSVAISSPTFGALIRYTTDGSAPSETVGTLYSMPVTVNSNLTLNAIAYVTGMVDSAVSTAGYAIVLAPPSFAFQAINLTYITNGAIAAVQNDANEPGGHWLALEGTAIGQSILYEIPSIPAGTYDLQMYWKGNTERGILSFALDGTVLGNNLDQYSANQTYPIQDYGDVTFTTNSTHTILLTVVGKNAASTGYWLSAGEFLFTLVQPPPPVFNGALVFSNGIVQLNGAGFPTLPYRVQINTNLSTTNWITIGTTTADTSGALIFMDTNAGNQPAAFYRLVTP